MIKHNNAILAMSIVPAIIGLALMKSPRQAGEVIEDGRAAFITGGGIEGAACPGTNVMQVSGCNSVCPINQQYTSGGNNGAQVDTYASCGTTCGGTYQNSIACNAKPTPKPTTVETE